MGRDGMRLDIGDTTVTDEALFHFHRNPARSYRALGFMLPGKGITRWIPSGIKPSTVDAWGNYMCNTADSHAFGENIWRWVWHVLIPYFMQAVTGFRAFHG